MLLDFPKYTGYVKLFDHAAEAVAVSAAPAAPVKLANEVGSHLNDTQVTLQTKFSFVSLGN